MQTIPYTEVNISTAAAWAEGTLNLQDWWTWLVLDHKPDNDDDDDNIDDDDDDDVKDLG